MQVFFKTNVLLLQDRAVRGIIYTELLWDSISYGGFMNQKPQDLDNGMTQEPITTPRVKAHVKAQLFREVIEKADTVYIMGHPISDFDCLGAAMGIYRMAHFSGKKARILLSDISDNVQFFLNGLIASGDYEEDLIYPPEEGLSAIAPTDLLVVIDTNRPSYTTCPEILSKVPVVVLDHHRVGSETIENPTLSYIEPYASSTAEMVAELIQYYDEKIELLPKEADAILSGIFMDTNGFRDKTGVRTFEAASYLCRNGADVTRVRKIFRHTLTDYQLRVETCREAKLFRNHYMIGICEADGENANRMAIAAQAANDLLNIRGIKAGFVFTQYDGKIYLSARSIDEVNVQELMGKLGGGGHKSIAGAQFEGISLTEAVEKLKAILEDEV